MSTLTRRKDPVTYIPLPLAVQKYRLDADRVQHAIKSGEIEIAHVEGSADPLLLDESLREWMAASLSRERVKHLEGQEISIYQASQKYEFSWASIATWIEKGFVKELTKRGRSRMINEADVAYARELANLKQPISGQSVFG